MNLRNEIIARKRIVKIGRFRSKNGHWWHGYKLATPVSQVGPDILNGAVAAVYSKLLRFESELLCFLSS